MRYLGHIHDYVTLPFQQEFLLANMAARTVKTLLRKTLQDLVLKENNSPKDVLLKTCEFLNCILGNTSETQTLWNRISFHSLNYFGVAVNQQQVKEGTFLLNLIEECQLVV